MNDNNRRHSQQSAVALEYDGINAPTITAKGRGELAESIITIAKAHDVLLHQDEALSALLSQLELGDHIPRTLYVSIAKIIAFAYLLEGKQPLRKR